MVEDVGEVGQPVGECGGGILLGLTLLSAAILDERERLRKLLEEFVYRHDCSFLRQQTFQQIGRRDNPLIFLVDTSELLETITPEKRKFKIILS